MLFFYILFMLSFYIFSKEKTMQQTTKCRVFTFHHTEEIQGLQIRRHLQEYVLEYQIVKIYYKAL